MVAGGAVVVAAGTGWLLWGQIERNGKMGAQLVQAEASIKAAAAALERQHRFTDLMAEINQAWTDTAVDQGKKDDASRTRVVYVTRTIRALPDAGTASRAPVRAGVERLRDLWAGADDIDRRPAGAAAGPARPDAPPGSAGTPAR